MSDPSFTKQAASNCPKCQSDDIRLVESIGPSEFWMCDGCRKPFFINFDCVDGSHQQNKRIRLYEFRLECICCGKSFEASRRDAKFCSADCRHQAWRDSRRTPEYLLRDNPLALERYRLLKQDFPQAAETVALALRNYSVPHGLEIMSACISVAIQSPEYRTAFAEIWERFSTIPLIAATNRLVKVGS